MTTMEPYEIMAVLTVLAVLCLSEADNKFAKGERIKATALVVNALMCCVFVFVRFFSK